MEKRLKFQSLTILVFCFFTLLFSPQTKAFEVEASNAPENNLSLTVDSIQSAQHSIQLNIYEFTSVPIAKALISQIEAGKQVDILLEGEIVNGMSPEGKAIEAQVVKAMQVSGRPNHFYVMTKQAGGKRRFVYDHAKYTVIDGESLLIGSENYSPTGNPAPGTLGNRGWEVRIHDPVLAQSFQAMFKADTNLAFGDVLDITKQPVNNLDYPLDAETVGEPPAVESFEAKSAVKITSPDTSLAGLTSLMNGAKSSIYIEQMSFTPMWGKQISPLLEAVEAAARRGIQVRVLLNDETSFQKKAEDYENILKTYSTNKTFHSRNLDTVNLLNKLAQDERLNVSAKIANLAAMGVDYIHNKGMLIDDDKTLVSSINWGQNSVTNNREAAVVITSTDVHGYFENLFEHDWNAGAQMIRPKAHQTKTTHKQTTSSLNKGMDYNAL